MLIGFFCSGTEGPLSSVMGKQHCRRTENTYPINGTSTEQGKPVSLLPQGGSEAARPIDGDAGMR